MLIIPQEKSEVRDMIYLESESLMDDASLTASHKEGKIDPRLMKVL